MKTICNTDTDALSSLLGENIVVRSVTFYYTGKLAGYDDKFLVLDDAAWIADTGRWSRFLAGDQANEVEPYPGRCYVALGGVIDLSPWGHALPRAVK